MDYKYAVVTSPEEVDRYFSGKRWTPLMGPSKFERNIQDEYYNIRLSPGESTYEVSIEAIDDPTDSSRTEEPTTDPIGFVSKFLRQDGVGDLSRVSFDPVYMARRLRQISTKEPKTVERILRRSIVLVSGHHTIRKAAENDLLSEIKKKGWEIEEENDREIVAIISDVYRVVIRSMGVEWDYQFEVQGDDSATVHGSTQDPIIKYREWYKRDSTIESVRKISKEREDRKKADAEARDAEQTVAPRNKQKNH